jgi:hypothetical protein
MIELGGLADEAEAGVVDNVFGLEPTGRKLRLDAGPGVGLGEVDRQHQRPWPALGGDLVGKRVELAFAPGDQHELVAVCGKHARKRRADAGRSAGDNDHPSRRGGRLTHFSSALD